MSTPVLMISYLLVVGAALLMAPLVRSALRSRARPDVVIALFFVSGAAGYLALLLRRTFPELSPSPFGWLAQLGFGGLMAPPVCIALFTWSVFRPAERWARATALTLAAVVVGGHAANQWLPPLLGGTRVSISAGSGFWIGASARALCFAWACAEAWCYWLGSRRRAALGLVDPLVSNRFLLWALWSGAAGAVLVIRVFASAVLGSDDIRVSLPTWVVVGQIVFALVCAISVWLTFAPPLRYRRWIAASG